MSKNRLRKMMLQNLFLLNPHCNKKKRSLYLLLESQQNKKKKQCLNNENLVCFPILVLYLGLRQLLLSFQSLRHCLRSQLKALFLVKAQIKQMLLEAQLIFFSKTKMHLQKVSLEKMKMTTMKKQRKNLKLFLK